MKILAIGSEGSIKKEQFGNTFVSVIDAKSCVDAAVNEIVNNKISMYSPEFF